MTQNTDSEVATAPAEPWDDQETLKQHIERGESYAEIATQYDGVSRHMIGERVRKFGLTAAGRTDGPSWEGKFTPLVTYEPLNVAFPIGVDQLEKMDIYDVDPGEYTIDELKKFVSNIEQQAAVTRLRSREQNGKNRTGALEVIEARLDTLSAKAEKIGTRGPERVVDDQPDAPDYLRFVPRVTQQTEGITFDIMWGPTVDGSASNDRAVSRPDTLHAYAQFPRALATSFGLHEIGMPIDSVEREAAGPDGGDGGGDSLFGQASEELGNTPDFDGPAIEITDIDAENSRMSVRLKNCSVRYVGVGPRREGEQADLEPEVKPLYELRVEGDVQSYRLDPSQDYVDAYGLTSGAEYAANVVPVTHNGEIHMGVGLHFDADLDQFHEGQHRVVSSYEAGDYDADAPDGEKRTAAFEQAVLYPGTTMLNAVGLPTIETEPVTQTPDGELGDSVKRSSRVKVLPFNDAIVLIPVSDE